MMRNHEKLGLKPLATVYDLPCQLLDLSCVLHQFLIWSTISERFSTHFRVLFFFISFLIYCAYELDGVTVSIVAICTIMFLNLLFSAYGHYCEPSRTHVPCTDQYIMCGTST